MKGPPPTDFEISGCTIFHKYFMTDLTQSPEQIFATWKGVYAGTANVRIVLLAHACNVAPWIQNGKEENFLNRLV